ncbi:hypothetical protein ACN20G_37170 (plasmid) [Streptomyces sp. BI20]|uniref:hypothetical protein n=1 Tax=Streptomyces sp. BI20 TaxID=3403460 RepID=UPI003C752988
MNTPPSPRRRPLGAGPTVSASPTPTEPGGVVPISPTVPAPSGTGTRRLRPGRPYRIGPDGVRCAACGNPAPGNVLAAEDPAGEWWAVHRAVCEAERALNGGGRRRLGQGRAGA